MGINILLGWEAADVGDLVRTIIVDSGPPANRMKGKMCNF
jgi:hypothetical protein